MSDEPGLGAQLAKLRQLLHETRQRNMELTERNKNLERHNAELREAIDALLQPAPSELLSENFDSRAKKRTFDP